MHTLAKNQHHNTRLIYDFLEKAYPNGIPTFDQLVEDNIINGTQLLELAVSRTGGIDMCPVGYNRDLIDDSDVKTVTVLRAESYKRRVLKSGVKKRYKTISYIARIKRVDKKLGVLRIICWNPFADKYQYFKVPPSAVYGLGNLAISFDSVTFEPIGVYAQYQVKDFDGMASKLTQQEQIDTLICNIDKTNVQEQLSNIVNLVYNPEPINKEFNLNFSNRNEIEKIQLES